MVESSRAPWPPRLALAALGLFALLELARADDAAPRAPRRVEFGRDVRPILSNHCFPCHGPDEGKRKAGLRLDTFEGATATLKNGERAIVPGDLDASELVQRITADSPKRRMPLASLGKPLSPAQIELLERWVAEGAEYKKHWSFVPPKRATPPSPPATEDGRFASWARNDVDRFLLARLLEEGLHPSPEAPRETLIRRASLALTGVPPTPAEIDAFLADPAPDAFENVVRQLLASPHFGEQMARHWLDLARYGDTHGFHLDNERSLWRWRDWVIDAFNSNKRFDVFTIEQLAGDLLPDATVDQKIATGFHRCNPTSGEGGLIEEEYLVKYAIDRVQTTSTVWLGLTLGCAQCHDHKFDPLTQRDFYQLFAIFNSIAEKGSDENALAPAPALKVPEPEQTRALDELRARIADERRKLDAPMPEIDAVQADWESAWAARLDGRWRVLAPEDARSRNGATLTKVEDRSVRASGENPAQDVYELTFHDVPPTLTALRLEALADESLPKGGPGRFENGNFVLSGFEAELTQDDPAQPAKRIAFDSALADHEQEGFPAANAIDGDAGTGWAILPELRSHQALFVASEPVVCGEGATLRVRLRFESPFAQHAIGRVRISATGDAALTPVALEPWRVLGPFHAKSGAEAYSQPFGPEATLAQGIDFSRAVAPDDPASPASPASRTWIEKPEWVDGKEWSLEGESTAFYLARTIRSPSERVITLSFGSDDALKVWLNGEVVLDRNVERSVKPDQDVVPVEVKSGDNLLVMKVVNYLGGYAFYFRKSGEEPDGLPLAVAEAIAARDRRSDAQQKLVRDHFRRRRSPQWRATSARVAELEAEEAKLDATIPPTMVCEELAQPRTTTILVRGQYDKHGDPVEPGVPAALGRLPDGAPKNRLALARWLVAPENPLVARVFVNRLWSQLFGIGIVKTAEDFGAQGEWPVHQELLDWLACEFVESGFDVKHLVELLVTSAAWRQSSAVTPELLARDRDNRWLARGPRFRLDAEEIRDLALAASGLLVERVGGKSVKPYQPGDLWKVVAYPTSNTAHFEQDHGEALWRRSLYTFWKRTSPPANLTTFDAPSRESCCVQRARTNTPLQALVLLNDVQFVEAARALAQRVLHQEGSDADDRITLAYRLLVARRPAPRELAILRASVERELDHFRREPQAAAGLIRQGEAPLDETLDRAELAAWTIVASTLLNLDETVTQE